MAGNLFNHEYPYTDFHELNLDWIINTIKKLEHGFNDFVAVNTIKFEGDWDINKSYGPYTVVNRNGNGFLSLKAVPAGITIDNADYWQQISDYQSLYIAFNARITANENAISDIKSDMTDAIGDITELQAKKDGLPLEGFKINLIGDPTINQNWADLLVSRYGAASVHLYVANNAEYGGTNSIMTLLQTVDTTADVNIICCGNNDYLNQNEIGNREDDHLVDTTTVLGGVDAVCGWLQGHMPHAQNWACLPLKNRLGVGVGYAYTTAAYALAISHRMDHSGVGLINLARSVLWAPWQTVYNNLYAIDGQYPNEKYSKYIAAKVAYNIGCNISEYQYNSDAVFNYKSNFPNYHSDGTVAYERWFINRELVTFVARYSNFDVTIPPSSNRFRVFDSLPYRINPYAWAPVSGYAIIDGKGYPASGLIDANGSLNVSIAGVSGTVSIANLALQGTYPVFFLSHN